MATIEEALIIREQANRYIEESKLAFTAIIEKYDPSLLKNINYERQITESFLLSNFQQQQIYESIIRVQEQQKKFYESLFHNNYRYKQIYETIIHTNDWQKQLYEAINYANNWQQQLYESIAYANNWQQQLYENITYANNWQQQFNEALIKAKNFEHINDYSDITEPNFEKILQQCKAVSVALKYDTVFRKNTKKKNNFKRKVSIKNAHALRQKYKNKQINSLCQNILSYSLNKLDIKATPFFIGIIEHVKDLPIPEHFKIYFSIMLIPLWIRLYYLITHPNALSEKIDKQKGEDK